MHISCTILSFALLILQNCKQLLPILFNPVSGNGYIPTSSLREILAALDEQLTPDQVDEMIAEIDTDSSGTVDFDGAYINM